MKTKRAFWTGLALVGIGVFGGSAIALRATPADAATKAPIATTTTVDQSASDPSFGSFLGACSGDSDCTNGNVCASFKKRGNHCTHACSAPSDCGERGRCTKQNRCGLNEPLKTEP